MVASLGNKGVPGRHRLKHEYPGQTGQLTILWLAITPATPHLSPMMKNLTTQNPKPRRSLIVGAALFSLLALSACAGAGTTDGGKTELDLRDFDRGLQDTLGGA